MKKNWNYAVINEYKKSKWFNEKAEDWLKKKHQLNFPETSIRKHKLESKHSNNIHTTLKPTTSTKISPTQNHRD